ncbi:hypothetical protein JZ751_014522 [Albula glossodonta]|uniref:transketolase n=1 Tax=Albula glossodonta TaxID=121402 RepID=A0A8T2MWT2_9TELE|nr:hypothetical protein JZ751_014522 [Albula glossodonta]
MLDGERDQVSQSSPRYRVYCLLGDGELSEGAVWEAMSFASYYQLDNLVAILDINRLGQKELCKVLCQPRHQPTAIIAKTIKGKGISVAEDKMGWHGKPLTREMADTVLKELHSRILNNNKRLYPATPMDDAPPVSVRNIRMPSAPSYKPGEKIATRKAYGLALAKLGRYNERVVALDGDTKNSTFSEIFKNEHPNRYVECYIAEQNMVSVAMGCAARDRNIVFASTFATFFTRAFDQLRMASISESNINLCGSHCGVSIALSPSLSLSLSVMDVVTGRPSFLFVNQSFSSLLSAAPWPPSSKDSDPPLAYDHPSPGEDGPSQMGLEDMAMFRALPTATVFYPSDGVSTEKAVELAANTKGICFIRTSRPESAIIYNSNEDFHVGQAKVVYKSNDDQVTVIGAGVTLHEALAAAEQLKKERINIRVIDPFTIKPLDSKTIIDHAKATRGRIVTVEDHYYEESLRPQSDLNRDKDTQNIRPPTPPTPPSTTSPMTTPPNMKDRISSEWGGAAKLTHDRVPGPMNLCSAVACEPGITVHRLAVAHVPRSGKPAELLKIFGIDKDAIMQAVKKMISSSANAK